MTWELTGCVHSVKLSIKITPVALQAELLHKHISEHLTRLQGLTVLKLAGSYSELK